MLFQKEKKYEILKRNCLKIRLNCFVLLNIYFTSGQLLRQPFSKDILQSNLLQGALLHLMFFLVLYGIMLLITLSISVIFMQQNLSSAILSSFMFKF